MLVVISVGLLIVAWVGWGTFGQLSGHEVVAAHATAALATVGGLGGIVALTVSYRRQATAESSVVRKDFIDGIHLLGDSQGSTRIAGVYELVDIADGEPSYRQRVVDILCGYLRTRREDDGPVESSILDAISDHVCQRWNSPLGVGLRVTKAPAGTVWFRCSFDLHGATFTEEVDMKSAMFAGSVDFRDVIFESGVEFSLSQFRSGADFSGACFNKEARFNRASF